MKRMACQAGAPGPSVHWQRAAEHVAASAEAARLEEGGHGSAKRAEEAADRAVLRPTEEFAEVRSELSEARHSNGSRASCF